jgi:hypothetical protein
MLAFFCHYQIYTILKIFLKSNTPELLDRWICNFITIYRLYVNYIPNRVLYNILEPIDTMKEITTIQLDVETREKLLDMKRRDYTYDYIVRRLIALKEQMGITDITLDLI